ncbi:uncharacterized protein LOC112559876 isoform X2 [Pomacea canaliculata]|uniref:uncharacterized protein LOC112559876 isoform X2 n=1 Tax=Pomacea canaliculata TaxID=400727 RepID=UPI000D73B40B|nr:uncharacterized protein LOC112559876 isoform X2 [Pomacea canaliculata]
MSTNEIPWKEFMLLILVLISMICVSASQKDCSSFNAADYIGQDTKGLHISYGDCSFKKTFCNYTQACTSGDANNWTTTDGGAVCPGKNGVFDSFSVLLSPLLTITQNTSLVFNYSQTTPGTLSVFIVTTTEITVKLKEVLFDGSFHKEVNIEPAVLKIGFRARAPNTGNNVTLSYVKLQTGIYTSTTASSTSDTSLTTSTESTRNTSLTTSLAETGKPEATSGSSVGVTVGVVVAVVVVVAAGVIAGFFIWRRRKQRENHNTVQEANLKVSQHIYENTGSSEVQSTTAESTDSVTYRNLYDAMNFEAPTNDIHIYKSIDT